MPRMPARSLPESESNSKVFGSPLGQSSGARFYRCALQVNPFDYQRRYGKGSDYTSEEEYNSAMIDACIGADVNLIAVTDHYRIKQSESLLLAARQRGIHALPGFEAATKDGVHLICIFDENRDIGQIDRIIGECGIHDTNDKSPRGKYDTTEFLDQIRNWDAICFAAHVTGKSGLLMQLSGQGRVNAWKHDNLLACAIPGEIKEVQDRYCNILRNTCNEYRRDQPVACINASDIDDPADFDKSRSSCRIKMSNISIEGLRQAFLDPASRVMLSDSRGDNPNVEITSIEWKGGFLDGTSIHLNPELNTLIGGRGVGKSTIIESIRYVFGLTSANQDVQARHLGIVMEVLRAGTKVSAAVMSHSPSKKQYLIERTVPNPPVVKNSDGKTLHILPSDVVKGMVVYGQHEISELVNSPMRLTQLLNEHTEKNDDLGSRKDELRVAMRRSRVQIVECSLELEQVEDMLSEFPVLEESQQRYRESGLEERLKEKSELVREENVFRLLDERLQECREMQEEIKSMLPIDTAFLQSAALSGMPNESILSQLLDVLDRLNIDMSVSCERIGKGISNAVDKISKVKETWDKERKLADERYESTLRGLRKSAVDGADFIQVRKKIESLSPIKKKLTNLKRALDEMKRRREEIVLEWEEVLAQEYRQIEKAANMVNGMLRGRVKVRVAMAGNRDELAQHIKELPGRTEMIEKALLSMENLSLRELSTWTQEGGNDLKKKLGLSKQAYDKVADADLDWKLTIEELMLNTRTEIELNVASEQDKRVWRRMEDLSVGQKATAVLLLALLDRNAPMIVDQPEDDLDNRFISEHIVPIVKRGKRKRQYILSTHNANIPVLGDSDQIVSLDAETRDEASGERELVVRVVTGSIDENNIKVKIEEVLEGGREAFETRRRKYGF